MYAIVETGGKQYRVKPGDTVAVERLPGEPGSAFDLGRVLLVAGDGNAQARVGSPGVEGAVVRAEVVEHIRGEKIIVFRYKSKVRYRRKTGHRQSLTRLRITDILVDGRSSIDARTQSEAPATTVTFEPSETPVTEATFEPIEEPASAPLASSGTHVEALARQEPLTVPDEPAPSPDEPLA